MNWASGNSGNIFNCYHIINMHLTNITTSRFQFMRFMKSESNMEEEEFSTLPRLESRREEIGGSPSLTMATTTLLKSIQKYTLPHSPTKESHSV